MTTATTNFSISTHFLLIGSGRLASHLHYYLHSLNISFDSWDRSQDPHLLKTKIASATHVLLAISDSSLESFYRLHLAGHDKVVVHFSGAKNFPEMICAHPLMTFSKDLYAADFYPRIHFTVTGAESLAAALPGLHNPFSVLPAEQKALYHAWCVMGGNFVTLLTSQMIQNLGALQIPAEALQLYSQQIVNNVYQAPTTALTGPLARKDEVTVTANLNALARHPAQKIYQTFLELYWPEYSQNRGSHEKHS